MKAEMSATGVITLRPETSVEAFALQHWATQAIVQMQLMAQNESHLFRGSKLIIDLKQPKEQP